ncbi:MAG TPA: MogA/MoaB family molybdenum cofactor biosynthesis protein [Terracidiphilus sp.]|nr:MogA/MoaB family molybdenum cofactor biosynthesis protein [Terracidiphilus sp.]
MLFAVLTVSDRCSRGEAHDTAGPAAVALLRQEWPEDARIETALLPDEPEQISQKILDWVEQGAHLVLTVGGTGLGRRDQTPEATRRVLDREAPGIAEAMRAMGATSNPMAWLSRGVAGTRGRTLIVNLPGSLRAVEESLTSILPLVRHGLETMAGTERHS